MNKNNALPGLMVAAPRSGSGKTTFTLGLMRALSRRDIVVQPLKAGPDYIDPGFHALAAGRTGFNVDGWAMRPALLERLVASAAGADIAICEALMGLFDGVAKPGACDNGSSAAIAARTGWPVVLVLDISGQSQTAGAIAHGFATFRADVRIAGVVLNKVASPRHEALARQGIEQAGLAVIGALPRRTDIVLPERHLGLVQAEEISGLERILEDLAGFVEQHCDIGGLLDMARPTRRDLDVSAPVRPPGQRIALARDAAFSFVYPHLIAGWRQAGAEILPFSPLADEAPSPQADIIWLPGGYPELHAGRLAGNAVFLASLRKAAETTAIHGECGGYMVLGEGLIDATGQSHAMAGLLALETSFEKRKMALGYRLARLLADSPLGTAGSSIRGHEFHYSTMTRNDDTPLFDVTDANGTGLGGMGSRRGHVSGSYFHMIDHS